MTLLEELYTAMSQYSGQLRKTAQALKAYETNKDQAKEKVLCEQYAAEKEKTNEYNNRVNELTEQYKDA
jgi:hypothetical protein